MPAGVVGATIRMYLEKYEPATGDLKKMPLDVIKELADVSVSSCLLLLVFARSSSLAVDPVCGAACRGVRGDVCVRGVV